jgi:tetratricopeptide (TPR) repeat protein
MNVLRLPMNIVDKIKKLLKEAELYHGQGLLNEAMGKYDKVTALVQSNEQLKSRPNLMAGITNKINALKKDMHKVDTATDTPEVSAKVQDLIKQLFVSSDEKDEETIALDQAIALAKFGQHERALSEFNELLKNDAVRVVAAKNIIRYHVTHTTMDAAVNQYEQWLSSELFVTGELNKLRMFLQGLMKKEGIDQKLPVPGTPAAPQEPTIEMPEIEMPEIEAPENETPGIEMPGIEGLAIEMDDDMDDEVLDINSIGITFDKGPYEGQTRELDVSFQSGNQISLLIVKSEKDLIDFFQVGETLSNVQFYSPIAMFDGTCVIEAKTMIESGPRRGDYSLDIMITGT